MIRQRRTFLPALGGSVVLSLAGLDRMSITRAASEKILDPQSPAAKNLNYRHDSADTGRLRRGRQFYTPVDDGDWGACVIFPGELVSANGVCDSWFARAG